MSKARLVIAAVEIEHRPISQVARDYRVARSWIYTLLARYRAEGEAGLVPRSRRPHTNPRQHDQAVEERIVELRKQLTEQGLDAGPVTIACHLEQELQQHHRTAPAVSTIHKILSRRGFITPAPRKRPRSSYIRFQAEQPNELWQTDITHWRLADDTPHGTSVEILNIIDDHSRLAIACTARPIFTAMAVRDCFRAAFTDHGLPAAVLSDNGMVFTARHATGPGGRTALQAELAALGVVFKNSRPYHPTTCGKVERFHQTLKKWLTRHQPQAASITELQTQLDTFADYYNTRRPHRSCDRHTPQHAYHARPLAGPVGTPAGIHWRLRSDTIDRDGKLTLRHAGRLHHIGIGRDHAAIRVLMLIADRNIRIIDADTGQLIRELILDPSRDYQPTGRDRYARWRH
jgi:transposase InsO family protein